MFSLTFNQDQGDALAKNHQNRTSFRGHATQSKHSGFNMSGYTEMRGYSHETFLCYNATIVTIRTNLIWRKPITLNYYSILKWLLQSQLLLRLLLSIEYWNIYIYMLFIWRSPFIWRSFLWLEKPLKQALTCNSCRRLVNFLHPNPPRQVRSKSRFSDPHCT